MPQLAPLNWVLLNFLFWGVMLLMMVIVWWMSNSLYSLVFNSSLEFSGGFLLNEWAW